MDIFQRVFELQLQSSQVIKNHLRDLKIYLVATRNARAHLRAQIASAFLHEITCFTI